MKKLNVFIIIVTISMLSCQSNTYEEAIGLVDHPTYEANVKPIIELNCLDCHGTSSTLHQWPPLETYAQVKHAAESFNLLCRINGDECGARMPLLRSMPQVNIDIINQWAAEGFANQ